MKTPTKIPISRPLHSDWHPRSRVCRTPSPSTQQSFTLGALAIVAALTLGSCRTTSISSSDPGFRGDLSEYQVVNSTSGGSVSEADIQRALRAGNQGSVRARPGSRVLLIQSGASTPDPALTAAMRAHYDVVPFSGIPPRSARSDKGSTEEDAEYSRRMRLAAAQAGARYIVCVWGLVDTNTEALPTKVVSWAPIVGEWIPDERQQSRIRLRAAVIETSSGSWSMTDGEPFGSESVGGSVRRRSRTTWQQEALKSQAFPELANRIARG